MRHNCLFSISAFTGLQELFVVPSITHYQLPRFIFRFFNTLLQSPVSKLEMVLSM